MKITENNLFAILSAGNWVVLALMAAGGLLFGTARFATGVLAGGLIAVVNCYWLYSILQRAMQLPVRKAVRFAQARYFIRLVVIAVIVSALIIYQGINIPGLLLGLSVLVVNIIFITIYISIHKGG
ncbi:MAG: atpI [Geobacteraceae bacterium]|nr:atpI [Geobacteraceae bacterium]